MNIKITDKVKLENKPTEFLASLGSQLLRKTRGTTKTDNAYFFAHDVEEGALKSYEGTFVLYSLGNICGQSKKGMDLLTVAMNYYRRNCLHFVTIFRVPTKKETLDSVLDLDNSFLLSPCEQEIIEIYSKNN